MKKILLYTGEGVGPSTSQQLLNAIQTVLSSRFEILTSDHRFFLSEDWEEKTALIIFPGGRDLPYHTTLKGKANTRIREYVEKGGRFLGICAGGYYGASYIEFEKGNALEICGSRELAFFPGKAIGPAYGRGIFSYESESGARAASIHWEKGICSLYFNGGCFFEGAEKYPSIQVIASYNDLPITPAAVVHCQVGKGAALLSGVHPELSVTSLIPSHQLLSNEKSRKDFLRYLINQILI